MWSLRCGVAMPGTDGEEVIKIDGLGFHRYYLMKSFTFIEEVTLEKA